MSLRPPHGRLTVLPALALAFLGSACSGAADTGLFGPVDTESTSPTEPGASGSAATTPGATPRDPSPSPGAPPPAVPDEPKPATPTEPPAAACTQEAEPNDVMQRATLFTEAICGQIASVADTDFVAVRAPANARKMKITHTENGAKITYRLFEDGDVRTNSLPASSTVSVDGGAIYAIRISAAQASLVMNATYEVRVTFE